MNALNQIKYNEAIDLIEEGDVLLFKGTGLSSFFIRTAGETVYTHVAIASKLTDGLIECIEFREGSLIGGLLNRNAAGGGRSVNLYHEVKKYSGQIDVYRPIPFFSSIEFRFDKKKSIIHRIKFDGEKVTRCMRELTGLPYGWKRIFWIAKHKMFIFRLFNDEESLMCPGTHDIIYPVCSTALSHCFNQYGYRIINNKSSEWTEPGDFARSTRLNYLFTLAI